MNTTDSTPLEDFEDWKLLRIFLCANASSTSCTRSLRSRIIVTRKTIDRHRNFCVIKCCTVAVVTFETETEFVCFFDTWELHFFVQWKDKDWRYRRWLWVRAQDTEKLTHSNKKFASIFFLYFCWLVHGTLMQLIRFWMIRDERCGWWVAGYFWGEFCPAALISVVNERRKFTQFFSSTLSSLFLLGYRFFSLFLFSSSIRHSQQNTLKNSWKIFLLI